jgi:Kef-type K+ transport system membrane component KefB
VELGHISMQILELGILVLAAYVGGKLALRLHVGEVIGQILGGMLVGPHFLEIVRRLLEGHPRLRGSALMRPAFHFFEISFSEYANILENTHFFVFLFLGLIAFSIGEELHRDRLREVGPAGRGQVPGQLAGLPDHTPGPQDHCLPPPPDAAPGRDGRSGDDPGGAGAGGPWR